MFNKALKIAVIVIFFAVLAVSALCSDFEGGKVSESQNRTLAKFPDIKSVDMTFDKFTKEFEDWSNDNIGFQPEYNRFYTGINTTAGIPSTDRVHYGKDGFYFITAQNGVTLATGEYVISDERLREIADNQQKISDYYKSLGKDYYVVLVPEKSSVYPEKIRGGNFGYTETTVDRIEKYLTENTDVKVINVKSALIESKESGNLVFMKTDTHWTPIGAYAAYNTIMDRLVADGVVSVKNDFSPDFGSTSDISGDLGGLIGADSLPDEKTNVATWNVSSEIDNYSQKYSEIKNIIDQLAKSTSIEISRNEKRFINSSDHVNHKTLQIYGDSLYLDVRQINLFFAENFETVQYLRVRSVCSRLDQAVDADVVIFSAFERLAEGVLSNPPALDISASDLEKYEEIPVEKADRWIGNKGILINVSANGENEIDGMDIVLDSSVDSYGFSGWAIDYNMKTDLGGLCVFADDIPISVGYGMDGSDVGEYFGMENVKNCRFTFSLKRNFIVDNNIKQLKFVMISSDGVHRYEPVVYNISVK